MLSRIRWTWFPAPIWAWQRARFISGWVPLTAWTSAGVGSPGKGGAGVVDGGGEVFQAEHDAFSFVEFAEMRFGVFTAACHIASVTVCTGGRQEEEPQVQGGARDQ